MFFQAGLSSSGALFGAALDSSGLRKLNVTLAGETTLSLDQLLASSGLNEFAQDGLGDLARIANISMTLVPRTSNDSTESECGT